MGRADAKDRCSNPTVSFLKPSVDLSSRVGNIIVFIYLLFLFFHIRNILVGIKICLVNKSNCYRNKDVKNSVNATLASTWSLSYLTCPVLWKCAYFLPSLYTFSVRFEINLMSCIASWSLSHVGKSDFNHSIFSWCHIYVLFCFVLLPQCVGSGQHHTQGL